MIPPKTDIPNGSEIVVTKVTLGITPIGSVVTMHIGQRGTVCPHWRSDVSPVNPTWLTAKFKHENGAEFTARLAKDAIDLAEPNSTL